MEEDIAGEGVGQQLASLRRKTVDLLKSNDASAAVLHARMSLDFQEQRLARLQRALALSCETTEEMRAFSAWALSCVAGV